MDLVRLTARGNIIHQEVVDAIDHLFSVQKTLSQFDFIRELEKVCAAREPELYQSYSSYSSNEVYRGTNLNRFAANKGMGMRRLVDIPRSLFDLIEYFYPGIMKERKWVLRFLKEFPQYRYVDSVKDL